MPMQKILRAVYPSRKETGSSSLEQNLPSKDARADPPPTQHQKYRKAMDSSRDHFAEDWMEDGKKCPKGLSEQ